MDFGGSIVKFDRLCKVVEKLVNLVHGDKANQTITSVNKILQNGKLFVFEQYSKEQNIEILNEELANDFMMPFKEMIIADPDSIILSKDLDDDQKGIKSKRFFVDCMEMIRNGNIITSISAGICIDSYVDIESGKFIISKIIDSYYWAYDGKNIEQCDSDNNKEEMNYIMKGYVQNVVTAVEEITSLNSSSNFVFEVTPKKIREPKKNKIPRSHERRQYTLLSPNKIRKIMKIDNNKESINAKSGHERRGHFRTLRSEYFKHRQGERIWIDPVWVGPDESTIGNKIYKVRLDI